MSDIIFGKPGWKFVILGVWWNMRLYPSCFKDIVENVLSSTVDRNWSQLIVPVVQHQTHEFDQESRSNPAQCRNACQSSLYIREKERKGMKASKSLFQSNKTHFKWLDISYTLSSWVFVAFFLIKNFFIQKRKILVNLSRKKKIPWQTMRWWWEGETSI
jgi:hypothetical protein